MKSGRAVSRIVLKANYYGFSVPDKKSGAVQEPRSQSDVAVGFDPRLSSPQKSIAPPKFVPLVTQLDSSGTQLPLMPDVKPKQSVDRESWARLQSHVPTLSLKNLKRLVQAYGDQTLWQALWRMKQQSNVRNPAGYWITQARLLHLRKTGQSLTVNLVGESGTSVYVAPSEDPLWQSQWYREWRSQWFDQQDLVDPYEDGYGPAF